MFTRSQRTHFRFLAKRLILSLLNHVLGKCQVMDPALEIEIAALSRQSAMNEALEQGDSDIQKFYANTTVYLTGGTGFLGKHLIEKLFRSCKITKMYLLIRSKKGKSIKERLEEMLEDPLFSTLQKRQPDFSSRLVCVEGEISEIRLGLSERDWQMLADEVEVIFHSAATTRLDEKLRTATRINVRGTREALLLARAAGRLKSFIHVSTAYCYATPEFIGQEVREGFYPTPILPETLIHLVEETDEQRLDAITPELLKNWPNKYTFCKAVAEEVLRTMSEGLPVCIIRPGIVASAYIEPTPGWTDKSTVYGATGILLGIGHGVIHVLLNDHRVNLGLVPCDYVTNAIIVAGRETSKRRNGGNNTLIYNVISGCRNAVSWKVLSESIENIVYRIVTPAAVYYAFTFETNSAFLYNILFIFVHMIPSYILDGLRFLLGRERKFVKLSKKANKIIKTISFYCLNEWKFIDGNTEKLYENLSKKDQIIFNFDIDDINWTEFIKIWYIGVRKYIIKENLKSTDKRVRNQFWFRLLHYFLTCVYFYVLWQVIVTLYYVCKSLVSLFFFNIPSCFH